MTQTASTTIATATKPTPTASTTSTTSRPEVRHATKAIITASHQTITWTSRTPAAHQAQIVEINQDLLNITTTPVKSGDTITLQLFDNQTLTATVTQSQIWGNGTLAVSATIDGDSHGYLTLSSVGDVLRVLATDTIHNKIYQLRYDATRKAHVLLDIDEAATDTLNCASGDHDHLEASPLAAETGDDDAISPTSEVPAASLTSETTTIDVLAIYTPAAKANEGGLANMEANISQSLLLGNQVLSNSDTNVQLNLVHSAEVNYTENRSTVNDLAAIKNFDGKIDEVHTLRDLYAADFVVFFIDTDSVGGQGYRPVSYDRPDLAFCLVRSQQSDTTSYTTIHEISHNMGNGHSKTQSTQAYNESFYTYAAGWQWNDDSSSASRGYCSVMTYENFNSSGDDEYQRVPHLSNPNVSYNGNATGHAEDGNAAQVIRDGRSYYEDFRKNPIPYPYPTYPYHAGFEDDELSWLPDINEIHTWSMGHSGSTSSSSTGPNSAHTGSNYAYVEASSHNQEAASMEADFDLSQLIAPRISFAYHMNDNNSGQMGTLKLEASLDEGQSWDPLWATSGNQGSAWQVAEAELVNYTGSSSVRLRFRAVTGSGYRSDIAIDSITIEDNESNTPVENFSTWVNDHYPDLTDNAADADSDGDGYSNFFEYALGLTLDVPETQAPTLTVLDSALKTFTFSFPRAQNTVRYQVHSTGNLTEWNSATLEWDSSVATDLVSEGEIQTVEIDASAPARFVRLNISE